MPLRNTNVLIFFSFWCNFANTCVNQFGTIHPFQNCRMPLPNNKTEIFQDNPIITNVIAYSKHKPLAIYSCHCQLCKIQQYAFACVCALKRENDGNAYTHQETECALRINVRIFFTSSQLFQYRNNNLFNMHHRNK